MLNAPIVELDAKTYELTGTQLLMLIRISTLRMVANYCRELSATANLEGKHLFASKMSRQRNYYLAQITVLLGDAPSVVCDASDAVAELGLNVSLRA